MDNNPKLCEKLLREDLFYRLRDKSRKLSVLWKMEPKSSRCEVFVSFPTTEILYKIT